MTDQQDPEAAQGGPQGPSEDAILAWIEEHGSMQVPDPEKDEHTVAQEIERLREKISAAKKPDEGFAGTLEAVESLKPRDEPKEAPEPKGPADDAQGAYEKALAAMRRYKTPDAVIEAMSREEAIAWGSHLAKIQGDFDRANTDLRSLKERTQGPAGREKAEEATRQVEAPPTPDLDAVTAEAAELLGLSKQEGGVLGKLFEAVTAPLKRELEERDTRDQLRDNAITELLVERTRGRLEGRFPQLADDGVFKELLQKAIVQVQAGAADNLPNALADAARSRFYDERQEALSSKVQKDARAKAKATSTSPSPRSAPQSLSHDERLNKVLDMLESGSTGEEAARAAGW